MTMEPTPPSGTSPPDAATKPRCQKCLGDAIKGGSIIPDEEPVRRRWGFCAFGDGWSWCNTFQRFKRR